MSQINKLYSRRVTLLFAVVAFAVGIVPLVFVALRLTEQVRSHDISNALFYLTISAGTILSLFLAILVWSLMTTRSHAKALAESMTRELRAAKEAAEAANRENRMLADVARRSRNGAVLMDTEGRIQWINEGFTRLTGYTLDEIIGKKTSDFLHGPKTDSVIVNDMYETMQRGEPYSAEFEEYSKSGNQLTMHVDVEPLFDERNQLTGFLSISTDVTMERNMEDVLRASMENFRTLADASPMLVWTSGTDAKFNYFNKPWLDFTGHTMLQELGEGWTDRVHPDDLEQCLETYQGAFYARKPFEMEYRLRRHDGVYREMLDKGVPRFDAQKEFLGYVGALIDVTEQHEAHRSLAKERTRLAAFVEHAPAAIAMFNTKMEYIAVSQQWVEEYQLAGQEIIGRSHYDVFPNISDNWKAIHKRCLNGAIEQSDNDVWRPAGWEHDQHLCWEVRPWHLPDGAIGGLMMFTKDITENKRREAEIKRLREEAEAANRTKSEFLANMSHEIRTPMTAILGYTDLILDDSDYSQDLDLRVEALKTIQRNGKYLLELINDILDLSKIEAGKMQIERLLCSPKQIVHDVEALMRERANAKKLKLTIECDGTIPNQIHSDPLRIRQILVNLIGNALKFTELGSVRVVMRCIRNANPHFEFDVIDTGTGMTAEQMQRLFNPFTQADTSMTRKFGGTGLGLTISKRLAQFLGGDVNIVQSSPGVGTTFRLTIAAGTMSDELAAENDKFIGEDNSAAEKNGTAKNIAAVLLPAGCKILLAEDGPDNQRMISFILKKAGAQVTVADNGVKAIEIAAAEQEPFDIVLMDMQMPAMDGYEAAAMLRKYGYTMPIIALTAHAMSGDREKCLTAGCTEYIAKPINKNELLKLIGKCLAVEAV